MKKVFILFLFVVSNIWLFAQNNVLNFSTKNVSVKDEITIPTRNVLNNQSYIELEYNFEDAIAIDVRRNDETFQLIKINGFGFMDDLGKPALPAYNDILAVPTKSGLSIQIIESQYKDFEDFYIYPALEPESDLEGDTIKQRFVLDKQIYSTDFYFPESLIEIISVQDYREIPFAVVQIRPIQYNPKTKQLRCYSKIKYRVTFENKNIKKAITFTKGSLDILRNVSSNPDMLKELIGEETTRQYRSSTSSEKNYIIVTTNRFLPAVQEFADWKIRMGYSCEIVSQTSWTSAQVKSAVHTRYSNWNPKPEYLLIVGDHEDVPGDVYSWSSYGNYTTDLYYVCMGGATDYTADMALGRVSVNSLEQAYLVLRKIINYERNPIINTSFYQTGLNCAQFQDDNINGYADRRFTHTSEEVRDYLISKGKMINRVYATGSSVYPRYYDNGSYSSGQAIPVELRKDISPFYPWNGNNTNIINEINTGKFYVLHRDHGYYNGWGTPNFSTADIANLTNGDKLPIVFSLNCQTGGYLQTECFAEKFIRHHQGGAVGVFAASQVSYSGYNDALAVGMFDAIWSNPGLIAKFGYGGISNPNLNSHSDIYKMGYVLNQGLLRMAQTWSASATYGRYQNEIFHYFGDPSMEMYTASPSQFANATISQNGTNITVTTGGVSGCTIAMTSLDHGESYFDVAHNVSSYTFTNVTEPCNVTITKHNYIPYLGCSTLVLDFTNQTITADTTIVSCGDINVQNVTVTNGAKLTLDAAGKVNIISGFEVELGSEFEITQ
jgi:Peptidase family C25./Propeptide_C25.